MPRKRQATPQLKTRLDKGGYKGEQKAMGSKISIADYERVIARLDSHLLDDPCAPYIHIAIKALDKNTLLKINQDEFTNPSDRGAEVITQEELKALHKVEKRKREKKKSTRNNESYKVSQRLYKQPVTLAHKLIPLPDELIRKIELVVQDFRADKKSIKKLFQTVSKNNRALAFKVINSSSFILPQEALVNYSTMQIQGFQSVEKSRDSAKRKIRSILKNPINGFKEEAISIVKNDNIPVSNVADFLPDTIESPLRRAFITSLIVEPKRARALYQNAFKTLPAEMFSEFYKVANQQGEYKDFHFKYIRSYIEKGGTVSYIKNSKGLVTDRQFEDVEWLMNNLANIRHKISKAKVAAPDQLRL